MTPDQYCQDKAARSGSSFYYSFVFLPEEQRRAITALYAFCREVDDVVDDCQEPAVARAKLDWWQLEVERLYAGQPQHPVTQALQPWVSRFALAQEYFLEILDGMRMDLEHTRYEDYAQLSLYCYRAAGVVGVLSAAIFGYEDPKTHKFALQLGTAFQLTNILRDVGEDLRRGRIYLPQSECREAGVNEAELLNGKTTHAIQHLLRQQAQRIHQQYERAFALLPEADRHSQRSAIIMANIYRALLEEIEKDGFRVLEHRISLTPLRKLWIAFRTVRQEKRRYRRHLRATA